MIDFIADAASWWTAARLTAAAAVAGVAVAAVGLIVTVLGVAATAYAAFIAVRQLRSAAEDSAERSRPVVTAELREQEYLPGYLNLVVTNRGPSAARDVVVTFSFTLPDVETTSSGQPSFIPTIRRRYDGPIPTLAPGQELTNLYHLPANDSTTKPPANEEPLPARFDVHVEYSGRTPLPRHEDTYKLDTGTILAGTIIAPADAPQSRLKQIAKSIEQAQKALTTLAAPVRRSEDQRKYAAWREREAAHQKIVAKVLPAKKQQGPNEAEQGRWHG